MTTIYRTDIDGVGFEIMADWEQSADQVYVRRLTNGRWSKWDRADAQVADFGHEADRAMRSELMWRVRDVHWRWPEDQKKAAVATAIKKTGRWRYATPDDLQ